MTRFEEMASKEVVCDICCRTMYPLPGNGWDNDRIICEDRECGAEIVFPTSTEVHNDGGKRVSEANQLDRFVMLRDVVELLSRDDLGYLLSLIHI